LSEALFIVNLRHCYLVLLNKQAMISMRTIKWVL